MYALEIDIFLYWDDMGRNLTYSEKKNAGLDVPVGL